MDTEAEKRLKEGILEKISNPSLDAQVEEIAKLYIEVFESELEKVDGFNAFMQSYRIGKMNGQIDGVEAGTNCAKRKLKADIEPLLDELKNAAKGEESQHDLCSLADKIREQLTSTGVNYDFGPVERYIETQLQEAVRKKAQPHIKANDMLRIYQDIFPAQLDTARKLVKGEMAISEKEGDIYNIGRANGGLLGITLGKNTGKDYSTISYFISDIHEIAKKMHQRQVIFGIENRIKGVFTKA
ncbi:hypothetical protein HY638_05490 [Candidatus Woesearchaeota archaeon]|nr:hypothetical protein [Candidatus Woesearchaeota archaeon]